MDLKTDLTTNKEEEYQPKSYVIETFETRSQFYDDDISPLIGYVLLAFAVITLVFGTYFFLGEYLCPGYSI